MPLKRVGAMIFGSGPKKLMLNVLPRGPGIDDIMILKMQVEPEALNVIVQADLTEKHPIRYHQAKVIYRLKGKNLPMEKLEKEVKFSEEKILRHIGRLSDGHGYVVRNPRGRITE
jgi:putative redox protein